MVEVVDLVTPLSYGVNVVSGKLGKTEEVPTFVDPLRKELKSGG